MLYRFILALLVMTMAGGVLNASGCQRHRSASSGQYAQPVSPTEEQVDVRVTSGTHDEPAEDEDKDLSNISTHHLSHEAKKRANRIGDAIKKLGDKDAR